MPKMKPALLDGRASSFWLIADDCLVHRHPRGFDYTSIPVVHLVDEEMLAEHVTRLRGKHWVRPAVVDELLAIAAKART